MKRAQSHRRSIVAMTLATILVTGIGGETAAFAKKPPKDDGRVASGEPVSCIMPSRVRNTRVIDDRTIDFEMIGRDVYRNVLPYSCPGLGFEQRFAYKLSTSQLCSVDTITVLQSGGPGLMQGATCGLGMFQKRVKPGK